MQTSSISTVVCRCGYLLYRGEMVNGYYNGTGTLYYPHSNKPIYHGQLANGLGHGHGTTYELNGIVKFSGGWLNGKKHGPGIRNKGDLCFTGTWNQGVLRGQCTVLYKKRLLYKGTVHKTGYNGFGTLFYPDSGLKKYEGEWKDGKYHGVGILFSKNGRKVYSGTFEYGLINGTGTSYYDNGYIRYHGMWIANAYHGKGTLYTEDGMKTFHGEWKNGLRYGNGTSYSPNETYDEIVSYTGEWKDDLAEGIGFIKQGDKMIRGLFKDGVLVANLSKTTTCGKKREYVRNSSGKFAKKIKT